MSNRFTERSQRIVLLAQEEAKRLNHDYVGTEHELLALIKLGEGAAITALVNLGVNLLTLRSWLETRAVSGDNVMLLGEIPFTPRAKKVLEYAVESAHEMNLQYVGTEHLLLGMMLEDEGLAGQALLHAGLTYERTKAEVMKILKVYSPAPAPARDPASAPARVISLMMVLLRNRMTYNDLDQAIVWARDTDYANKQDPFYKVCEQLAEALLDA